MLTHFFTSSVRTVGLGSILVAACSFYTDCPCANQPKPATNNSGAGTGGAAAGTANSGGSSGLGDFMPGAGAAGSGDLGNGGDTNQPPPAVWQRAVGNLAGRSAACGQINFLSAKPDEDLVILSVNEGGLFGSRDGGATWDALGSGSKSALVSNIPSVIVYDPDNSDRFWEAGIYGNGIYRTDDDGVNFTQLGVNMDTSVSHNDYLSIDFHDSKRRFMLAGGHEQGATLYRSTDGGENWDKVGDTIPASCEWSSFPVVLDSDHWLLGCRSSIYATSDGGATWEVRSSYGGATAPLVTSNGTIYWSIALGGGLVRSDDDGETWQRVVGGGVVSQATPIELPDGSIAALSGKVIVRSSDDGVTWDTITSEMPFNARGFVYSVQQGAFFVYQDMQDCNAKIPKDLVLRYDIQF